MRSIKTLLRHLPGLTILLVAIALFGGAVTAALAHEREMLRAEPYASNESSRIEIRHTPSTIRSVITPPVMGVLVKKVVIPNAKMNYYGITGDSAAALREQMNALGPKDPQSQHADAYTDWYVSWNWPGYGRADCDLSQVRVSYAITVTFPSWQPAVDTDPELVDHWQRYTQRLALHEKGHVDNIVKSERSMRQAVQRATCTTAEAAAQQVLESLHTFDTHYDQKTDHGATQGATFP